MKSEKDFIDWLKHTAVQLVFLNVTDCLFLQGEIGAHDDSFDHAIQYGNSLIKESHPAAVLMEKKRSISSSSSSSSSSGSDDEEDEEKADAEL